MLFGRDRNSQAPAASGATTFDDIDPPLASHTLAKTVGALAAYFTGLISALHICSYLLLKTPSFLIFVKGTFKHSCKIMSRMKIPPVFQVLPVEQFSLAKIAVL